MRMRTSSALALAMLAATALVSLSAQPFDKVLTGKVVAIADGDTLTLLDSDQVHHKIRLEGIDAPETGQAFGTQAKKALSERAFGKDVQVRWKSKDKYGRTLGHIHQGEHWINLELVASGMAWHYKEYSSDKRIADAETEARSAKVGIWRDDEPVAPWDYRHGRKKVALGLLGSTPEMSVPGKAPIETTVYVTKSGTKYHLEGCRHLSKSKIAMPLKDAEKRYTPCSTCKP